MKLLRYLGVAVLASLVGLCSASGAQGCTVTISPGSSIQEAINRANEGAVICLAAGAWKENVVIEKGLTLRAAEVKPEPSAVIQSAKKDWPVILIRSEEAIEVVLQGLKVTGAFGGCYTYDPEWICADGVSVHGQAKAVIQDTTISGNKDDGILMGGSTHATIEDNKILNNGEYGVACYQRPCFNTDLEFKGAVRGSNNEISGNKKADVCPAELEFLKTSAGGCYGPKC